MTTPKRMSLFASSSTNESDNNNKEPDVHYKNISHTKFLSPKKSSANLIREKCKLPQKFARSLTLPEEKTKQSFNNSSKHFYHSKEPEIRNEPNKKRKKKVTFRLSQEMLPLVEIIDVESFKDYYAITYTDNPDENLGKRKVSCSCSCKIM